MSVFRQYGLRLADDIAYFQHKHLPNLSLSQTVVYNVDTEPASSLVINRIAV